MIGCPNCHQQFEHDTPFPKRIKCPKCEEEFYSYMTLLALHGKRLKRAYRYLKKKPYFDRVYNYLDVELWQERMEE